MHLARFVLLLSTLFLASVAHAEGGWKALQLGGIHYAVPVGALQPDRWSEDLRHTPDCEAPCVVEFDDRLSALHLRYKWAQLNPAPGVYDFDALGAVIDEVQQSGKLVTLNIMAGKYTPDWVFDAGADYIDTPAKTGDRYSQPNVPLPWDPVLVSAYQDMIVALADYLKQDPVRYWTVALVKNGLVVVHSGETRLMPVEAYFDRRNKQDRAETDAYRVKLCEDWAAAGYQEDRVLAAFSEVTDTIARAFADQYVGLAYVGGPAQFPTVNARGQCAFPEKNQTSNLIIKDMVKRYGARAVINNTVLTDEIGNPPIMDWVLKNGGQVAYQVNQQEVGCNAKTKNACDEDGFESTLNAGLTAGALYIEVHDGNINKYQSILRAFNSALR